jgi:hypothetical protein
MKHIFLGALLLLSASAQAQHETNAEEEGSEDFNHHCLFKRNSISIGVGGTYSIPLSASGVNTRAYYNIGEHICFGPEFSFFRKEELKVLDFNIIGHYVFETKLVGIYPLIGMNYTIEKDTHESESALGVVFGGGFHRNLGLFTVFAEFSHVESHLRDDFITVGAMINIK